MAELVRVLRFGDHDVEVVGGGGAAQMIGVSRQRFYQLLDERPDFPRPVTYEPEALWDRGQVAEWASRERPPGRPLPEAHRRVKEELTHIPRGERGSPQRIFRDAYTIVRFPGISKGRSAWQALQESLEYMQRDHPEYRFEYDERWFRTQSETG